VVLSAYLFVWLVYLWVCLCGVYGCVLVWLVVMLSVGVFGLGLGGIGCCCLCFMLMICLLCWCSVFC